MQRFFRPITRAFQHWVAANPLSPFPLRKQLQGYSLKGDLPGDLRAAFDVALLAVPQGMAYAAIAELPIVFGIVCSAIAALVAPFFASSRHTILGPTNATSLMVFSFFAASTFTAQEKLAVMPLMVLMVGVICTVGALFKAADLLQYISQSVLVGYITGAAILIIASQAKHILGVADLIEPASNFFGMVGNLGAVLAETAWQPLVLGGATLAAYLVASRFFPKWPVFAIVLIGAAGVSAWMAHTSPTWADAVPTFGTYTLADLKPRLPTVSENGLFSDISSVFKVALAVAFLASLENTVMAKSLASRSGQRAEVNQDMLSVGLANIACAFTAAMPASGSLTRSALNYESGARSSLSSLICGVLCLAAAILLAFIQPNPVSYIPKAALAALVVGVAFSLIKWRNIRICLRTTNEDAAVILITFAAALTAPLYAAIFFGVSLSIALFLRKVSRPHLVEYEMSDEGDLRELPEKKARPNPLVSIVHVEGSLFFGAADLFLTQIQRISADPNLKVIILRLKNAYHLDATSVLAMRDLVTSVRADGRHILVSGANREVYKILKKSGVIDVLQDGCDRTEGQTNIFFYAPSNPNLSTRDALFRAQELLGDQKAEIKIYFDPSKENES